MFRRRAQKTPGATKIDTYIGKDARIEGALVTSGSVRVDGFVEGTLRIEGDLIIGAGALVVASVSAANVTVAGELRGEVDSPGRLDIAPTGKMIGDVIVGSFAVDDGALFLGKCDMKDGDRREPGMLPAPNGSSNSDSEE
ncbi:MAG: bactofilin family protein [Bacillota bacterium]|jgi:cytoskeletal protein CcmA (bactofilin family)|nr:polymer-forming cytoskeletal protein [Bacillota bacterium]